MDVDLNECSGETFLMLHEMAKEVDATSVEIAERCVKIVFMARRAGIDLED